MSIRKTSEITHPVYELRDNKYYTVIKIYVLNILALCISNNSSDVCLFFPPDDGQIWPETCTGTECIRGNQVVLMMKYSLSGENVKIRLTKCNIKKCRDGFKVLTSVTEKSKY